MNLDHDSQTEDREAFEARMDSLGVDQVRQMQAMGAFPTQHNAVINAWLGRGGKPEPRTN